jgi:hypothetical protein
LYSTIFNYASVTKTPSDAKGYALPYLNEQTGLYFLQIVNESTGYAELVYMDKDTTLNGTLTYSSGTKETYNNVTLKQGWNYLIYSSRTGTSGNYQRTVTAGSALPSGYSWWLFREY